MKNNIKKIITISAFLFCTLQFQFAQNATAALNKYYQARDLEAVGKTVEANKLYNETINICKSEIANNITPSENYVVWAWSLLRLQKFNETIQVCKEGLKISPEEYRHHESMGEAYFYLDRYNESITMFETYLNAFPNGIRSATAFFFLGEIYRLTFKYEHSDIAYTAALRKEPTMSLWWYRLGRVRESAGKNTLALEAYKQAVKLRPNYKDAQEAIKRLS